VVITKAGVLKLGLTERQEEGRRRLDFHLVQYMSFPVNRSIFPTCIDKNDQIENTKKNTK
jgi:hypothetical protein